MSVNNEQLAPMPSTYQVRYRWATCGECGNHFPVTNDSSALEARLRRVQLDAERIEILARVTTLSEREHAVMLRIARGRMPMAIAEELGIDVKTVSTYRARLMDKLNLTSNAEIAVAVYKAGLLQ